MGKGKEGVKGLLNPQQKTRWVPYQTHRKEKKMDREGLLVK